jgi:hypothetical protein
MHSASPAPPVAAYDSTTTDDSRSGERYAGFQQLGSGLTARGFMSLGATEAGIIIRLD